MDSVPFQDITPTSRIWVSPNGNDSGSGSASDPLKSIQAAVSKAVPGTAIMVTAGEYHENIKLPSNGGGTPDAPIWLVSADGLQAAKIVPLNPEASTIKGLGTDNYVISGFLIEGGKNGIQFGLSGWDFNNTVRNVVIEGNTIVNVKEDGIKISQADNVHVIGNTIIGAGDQGIDFVAVNNSTITHNETASITGAAAIFAKGGSTNILIANNHVHDVLKDGIAIGGWSDPEFFMPGYTDYEARNVEVVDNLVENVGMRPLNILGAWDSSAHGNYFKANPNYFAAITVVSGNPYIADPVESRNIDIYDNIIASTSNPIYIAPGNDNNIQFHDNATDGEWSTAVGASASPPHTVALRTLSGTDAIDVLADVGYDAIAAGAGHDAIFSSNSVRIDGGAGTDHAVLHRETSGSFFFIDVSSEAKIGAVQALADNTTLTNVDRVSFYAGSGGSLIYGSSTHNGTYVGGAGIDEFHGGAVQDRFVVGSGDRVYAQGGNDYVELRGTPSLIDGGEGSDTVRIVGSATFGVRSLIDVEVIQVANGSMAFDRQTGSGDKVDFSALYESSLGTGAVVTVSENAASGQTAVAPGGTLGINVVGSIRNDKITGGQGVDLIDGGIGDDVIRAGGAADRLTGGAGNDTFVFDHLGDAGDYITDFDPGFDVLDLRSLAKENPGLTLSYVQTAIGLDVVAHLSGQDLTVVTLGNVLVQPWTPGIDVLL